MCIGTPSSCGLQDSTPRHGESAKKRRLSEDDLLALTRAGTMNQDDPSPVTPPAAPPPPVEGPQTPVHSSVEMASPMPNPWDVAAVAASLPSPRASIIVPRGRVVVQRKDRPAALRGEEADLHASACGKRPESRRKRPSRDHDHEPLDTCGLPSRRPIAFAVPPALSLGCSAQAMLPQPHVHGWRHPKVGLHVGPAACPSRYTLVKRIGVGACATVWHATDTQTSAPVALKMARDCDLGHLDGMSPAPGQCEVAALRATTGHPNVLPLLDSFGGDPADEERPLCLVTALADCDLFEHIQRRGPLPEAEARPLFRSLVSALEALHCAGYCHRDLKLDNLFLSYAADGSTPEQFFLGDLGAAAPCDPADHDTTGCFSDPCGSPSYAAPEVTEMWSPRSGLARGSASYRGHEADIWSTGIVLYAMVAGEFPFEAASAAHLRYQRFTDGEHDWPPHLSVELVDLLQGMLRPPSTRLALTEIEAHPWLQGSL